LLALVAIALTYVAASVVAQFQMPYHLQDLSLGLARIAWFMPFFLVGWFVASYQKGLRSLGFLKWVSLIAFPVFLVLPVHLPWWHLSYTFAPYAWPVYPFSTSDVVIAVYGFEMSLLGIGMTFAMVDLVVRVEPIRRILAYLGTITLGIYVIHSLWLKVGFGTGAVKVFSVTLIALAISVVLVWILGRFKITDYLLLGGAQKLIRREAREVSAP